MKRAWIFLWFFVVIPIMLIPLREALSQESAGELYEAGLFKKEADGDLEGAIQLFLKVITEYPQDKETGAKAQLQIGICYEKLRVKDASEAYQKVIDNYPGQEHEVALARARLAALGHPITPSMVVREIWVPAEDVTGMPSPDGRYLTYVDWNSANLALRDLTTGESRLLTDEGTWMEPDQHPYSSVWSPDGKRIAYSWFNKDIWELRLVGFDGSEPRVLYHNEDVRYIEPHEWSRDGQYILMCFRRKQGPREIGLVSVADGFVQVLKSRMAFGAYPISMSISPNGRYIIHDMLPEEGSSQRDIFLLTIDGSREVPLVEHSAADYGPVWTPDGNQIVFVSDRTGNPALWALEVVDGKPQGEPQLIEQNMDRMVPMGFTRDGAFYYAFTTYGGGSSGDVYIAALDPATGKVLTPPEKIPQRSEGSNASPAWSPDGKYLAYVSVRGLGFAEGLGSSVLVIRSVGTGEERELPLKRRGNIRWCPDGRSILVSRHHGKGGHLYLINAQTGDITPIVQDQPQIWIAHAASSHDGKEVFYLRQRRGRTAYIWSIVERDLETGEEITRVVPEP